MSLTGKNLCRILPCALLLFFVISCEYSSTSINVTKQYRFENIPLGRKALTVTNESLWEVNAQINRSAVFQNKLQWKISAVKNDLEEASRFNANPPLVSASRAIQRQAQSDFNIGDTRTFFVTNKAGQFEEITAALRKKGEYCKVWVANRASYRENNRLKYISAAEAEELADTFDTIYPLATNLLGYEKGGGPEGDGGIDGDKDIQILIYNCAEDDVLGFFWGKDEYTQSALNSSGNRNLKSNEAEIFYINAGFFGDVQTGSNAGSAQDNRKLLYSALIHEFQHMINFNRKALALHRTSATWYDEMLSLLAEDIIGPMIGIDKNSPGHPVNSRIPLFLGLYWDVGVNQWLSGDEAILSYSAVYAFGAYLVRNYGGPALLKAIMDNDAVNDASISRALGPMNINGVSSFEQALNNYAQALLYSGTISLGGVPDGKPSFDRTQESVINGIIYTAEAFDIWSMKMSPELLSVKGFAELFNVDSDYKGPVLLPYAARKLPMPGCSIFLLELPTNIAGTWSTNLTIQPGFTVINLDVVPY